MGLSQCGNRQCDAFSLSPPALQSASLCLSVVLVTDDDANGSREQQNKWRRRGGD